MLSLENVLISNREKIGEITSLDFNSETIFIFDFTKNNKKLQKIDMNSAKNFNEYVNEILKSNHATLGIGKYNEDRTIYKHSTLFGTERTIHIGIDVILPAKTVILSPLDAVIHSFQNNRGCGDYGPTIILQHELAGITFYTLYGHLSEESLHNKKEGQKIKKGEIIGWIGNTQVNGDWFEHVHFQIIADMLGKKGDFPAVINNQEISKWLKICPNPNLILKINILQKH